MIAIALKVAFVLAAALGAAAFLRRRSAALRHWIIAVGVCLGAVLPAAAPAIPQWHPHLAGVAAGDRAPSGRDAAVRTDVTFEIRAATAPAAPSPRRDDRRSPAAVLAAAWLAGSTMCVAILLVGLVRLKWLTRDAETLTSGPWIETADCLAARLGVRAVRLVVSRHPTLLATWGFARPRIVLPSSAPAWPDERIRIVLSHELAHVRRGDWVVQLLAEFVRALYWFNPLAWLAAARLRRESEYACDDLVLEAGIDGRSYASHLLELVRELDRQPHPRLPVPAMARRSSLEGRVKAMLNPALNRTAPPLRTRAILAAMLVGLAAPIAAFSGQGVFSTLSGTITDQTNRAIPNVPVVLTETAKQEKHEVRTDRTGQYSIVGLTPGTYVLSVQQPGFAPFKQPVEIQTAESQQNVELRLDTLHESVTIRTDSATPPPTADLQARRRAADARYQQAMSRCSARPNETGGNILAPRKLVDVKPIYPPALKDSGVGGVVTMNATIGTDGQVRDVQVLSSPDPQLSEAAKAAVQQWQFSSTLLDCTPVDVTMHVTTTFVAER